MDFDITDGKLYLAWPPDDAPASHRFTHVWRMCTSEQWTEEERILTALRQFTDIYHESLPELTAEVLICIAQLKDAEKAISSWLFAQIPDTGIYALPAHVYDECLKRQAKEVDPIRKRLKKLKKKAGI